MSLTAISFSFPVFFFTYSVFCSLKFHFLEIFFNVLINPFWTNALFLRPLKISENQRFSDVLEIEYWLKMG